MYPRAIVFPPLNFYVQDLAPIRFCKNKLVLSFGELTLTERQGTVKGVYKSGAYFASEYADSLSMS
jgi:hypothetical protein